MITTRNQLADGGNVIQSILDRGQEFIETKIEEWLPGGTPVNTTVSTTEGGNVCPPGYRYDPYLLGGNRCVPINQGNNSSTPNGQGTLPSNYFESGTYNLPMTNSSSGNTFKPQETVTYAKPKSVDLYFEQRTLNTRDFDCSQLENMTHAQKRWLESNPAVLQKIQAICTDRIITPPNTWFGISPMWYFVIGAIVLFFFSLPKNSAK